MSYGIPHEHFQLEHLIKSCRVYHSNWLINVAYIKVPSLKTLDHYEFQYLQTCWQTAVELNFLRC